MIQSYSTQLNGKLTNFVERILNGLMTYGPTKAAAEAYQFPKKDVYEYNIDLIKSIKPKYHTIRKDKHGRWKPGNKIHFVIFNRSKKQLQFAPVINCVSVQDIKIEWPPKTKPGFREINIYVDGRLLNIFEKKVLALNDGFDTLTAFEIYFGENFTGKIIHWTNFKY